MPIYEYQCGECGGKFDKLVRFITDTEDVACPACGGEGKRVISAFAYAGGGGDETPCVSA